MSRNNSLNNQELLARIKELETEVKQLKSRKKYGLVWEDKPEDVVLLCAKQIPVLKEIKNRKIVTDNTSPTNLLIEGDNYHALSVLNYTHKGKIDVIYIDPPYNTGNKDFIYNDNYVDREDSFRHSKWLSFMDKRLRLAKDLLKDNGVIFISIDDNEFSQLKILCDSIFGENNSIGSFIWQKQGNDDKSIFSGTKTFRKDHEYISVYAKNYNQLNFERPSEVAEFKNEYGNTDNDPRGNWMSAELGKSENASLPHGKNYFTFHSPSGVAWTRQWHFSREEIDNLILNNQIYFGKKGDAVPRLKKFTNEKVNKVPSSLILNQGSTKVGIGEIEDIFNSRIFDYPKPLPLIKYLFKLRGTNSTILDFMAGSGTT